MLLVTGLSPLRSRLLPVRPLAEARSSSLEAVPDPVAAARAYLDAWQRADFQQMYSMVSFASRAAVTEERFVATHRLMLEDITARRMTVELLAGGPPPSAPHPDAPITTKVPFRLTLETELAGDYSEDNELPMVLEAGEWHVAWSPAVILRDLVNGNQLALLPQVPQRGRILDRFGRELATQQVGAVLGVVPARMVDEGALLADLARFLKTSPEEIRRRYAGKPGDWWAPIEDLTSDQAAAAEQLFAETPGVQVWWRSIRTYPNGSLAVHALGYVSPLTQEELAKLAPMGYRAGDYVGRAGVEEWAEAKLAGRRGGKLAVVAPDGRVVRVLTERPPTEGLDVVLTLDMDLQRVAEEALGDRPGSLVVMDPRDNSILAIASHPSFDPNALVRGLSQEEWEALTRDRRQPFQNRATLSAYPTGSVFKVITMAAGLERGGYRPNSRFVCRGQWEAFGQVWGDWLPGGHGSLDLRQGLMQSCNIVFYEIGRKLDAMDQELLPNFAREFGLGEPTGVVGLAEVAGTVPSPSGRGTIWRKSGTLGTPLTSPSGRATWRRRLCRWPICTRHWQPMDRCAPPFWCGRWSLDGGRSSNSSRPRNADGYLSPRRTCW